MIAVQDEDFVRYGNEVIPPGFAFVKARMTRVSRSEGLASTRFDLGAQHMNIFGFVCGGYISLMLDYTGTVAARVVTNTPHRAHTGLTRCCSQDGVRDSERTMP